MLALGGVTVERGGIGVAITRQMEVGDRTAFALALAPRMEIQAGGRVIMGLREAVVAGIVAGLLVAFLAELRRRLRRRPDFWTERRR